MTAELLARTCALVLLGTVSVSLWTVRIALTARGRRFAASAVAGVEATVFVLVFASVLSSLNSPVEIGGYAVGVATGTLLGIVADARLSKGKSTVRVIVDGPGDELASMLRTQGWPVTRLQGDGLAGFIALLLVVVDDAQAPRLVADLHRFAPTAFWTIERLQHAKATALPAGYRQIARGSRREPVAAAVSTGP